MRLSFTYYLALFVIKLKGIKKDFSKTPIDYNAIRRHDVQTPKGYFFKQQFVSNFKIANTSITQVKQQTTVERLLIMVPGGAYISGPSKHHWDTIKLLYKKTKHTIWLCNYPKAPEHTINTISDNLDAIYTEALTTYKAEHITLIGDSVGGSLITSLTQRLIKHNKAVPAMLILVCPVMDATLSNPDIEKIDPIDPLLSKTGILSAKKMCAGSLSLKDPMLSPLNGSFRAFPKTLLFLAENDIMYPDGVLAAQKLTLAKVNTDMITGAKMPHIWPFIPVMKEAKIALNYMIKQINQPTITN